MKIKFTRPSKTIIITFVKLCYLDIQSIKDNCYLQISEHFVKTIIHSLNIWKQIQK